MLLQLLVNSFSLGSFYALVALGFSLIFGVTHAFNLAHGELILLSGYLAYALNKYHGFPFFGTLPLCMLSLLVVSLGLNKLLKYVKEPFELNTLVVTFGLALVLQNAMLILFSANYRLIQAASAPIEIGILGLMLTRTQVLLIGLSLLATVSVHLLLRRTFLGKALRATIQDREGARLAGIRVNIMSMTAFGIGGLLIGLAGPLYGREAYLHPSGGNEATLIAIIITIFAGVGRIRGILLGGWTLGLVESVTTFTMGASWRELVSALILISLLLLRPHGLMSRRIKAARRQ